MTTNAIVSAVRRAREQLAVTLPTCPETFADWFMQLISATPSEITARAIILLNKPYGTNAILVDRGEFGLSFAQLLPGRSTSLHFHQQRREFFCVHHGTLSLTYGDQNCTIERFACGHSTPNVSHMLANASDQPLGVLEIFSPALLNDKVRLQDRYERPLGSVTFDE